MRVIWLNELPPSSVNGHWCRFPREAAIPFQAIPFLSVQGQAVWDLGQPRLVEGVPAYGSAIGVTWVLRSLQPFWYSVNLDQRCCQQCQVVRCPCPLSPWAVALQFFNQPSVLSSLKADAFGFSPHPAAGSPSRSDDTEFVKCNGFIWP